MTELKENQANRTHNTGQNLKTGISVFLIHETRIPVLIPVFQNQTFFSINLDGNYVQ
jgi:hypothetical protein